jgi:ribosomal protein S18 acetylase RimI-like enzyme
MALRIRSARPADVPAVAALHVASWRDAYRDVLDARFLAGPIETALGAHWQAMLGGKRRPGAVILATAAREVAGFAAAWREGTNCHVDNLHVRPGMRNAGIGRALLGFAARRLETQGCTSADLWVFARNAGALRFYARLGAELGPEVLRETQGQMVLERRASWAEIGLLIAACASDDGAIATVTQVAAGSRQLAEEPTP